MTRERARRSQVPVITGAPRSPKQQLRSRQIRYATLMGLRVVCLILAAVLVSLRVPYALLWILLLTAGMMIFPWMAVLIANDRPPREETRFRGLRHRGTPPAATLGRTAPQVGSAPTTEIVPLSQSRVVDQV